MHENEILKRLQAILDKVSNHEDKVREESIQFEREICHEIIALQVDIETDQRKMMDELAAEDQRIPRHKYPMYFPPENIAK